MQYLIPLAVISFQTGHTLIKVNIWAIVFFSNLPYRLMLPSCCWLSHRYFFLVLFIFFNDRLNFCFRLLSHILLELGHHLSLLLYFIFTINACFLICSLSYNHELLDFSMSKLPQMCSWWFSLNATLFISLWKSFVKNDCWLMTSAYTVFNNLFPIPWNTLNLVIVE